MVIIFSHSLFKQNLHNIMFIIAYDIVLYYILMILIRRKKKRNAKMYAELFSLGKILIRYHNINTQYSHERRNVLVIDP